MRKQTDLNLGWPESEYIFSNFFCVNMKCIHVIRVVFRTFVRGWRMFCLALVSISVSSSSGLWCRARATAVLHLHWRGISYWALITVLIYKGNRSLSFKSQYCQITLKSWHGKETDRACPSFPERNCFLESSPLIHISHLCPSFFCSSVQKSDTILMNYNFIKRKECTGVAHLNTYIVWLWLSHWNPFKDTQWSVSNRHPFFLPVNC